MESKRSYSSFKEAQCAACEFATSIGPGNLISMNSIRSRHVSTDFIGIEVFYWGDLEDAN